MKWFSLRSAKKPKSGQANSHSRDISKVIERVDSQIGRAVTRLADR